MKAICLILAALIVAGLAAPVLAQVETPAELIPGAAPPFSRPVDPDLYLIRPGDQLQVTFIQSQLAPMTLDVDPEGRVVDNTIGIYDLSFKTLSQAREILEDALRSLYNVSGIDIGITRPRSVSISIRGAVRQPGIYNVFTSQRVSEVIELAGGILDEGSRRWISLSGGPDRLTVDLDRAVYMGDMESDPYVYAGQSIRVPNRSKVSVDIAGEINTPRELELVTGDDFVTIMRLAGGVRRTGDTTAAIILRKGGRGSKDDIQAGDIIIIPSHEEDLADNPIIVFGAVKMQGLYDFESGMTLADAIEKAGGLLADANASHVTVFRRPRVDESGRLTYLRYPIWNITNDGNGLKTVRLQPEDSIFVPVTVGFVAVEGEVLNPGYFPYVPGKSALFYIQMAGGFLANANREQISLFNAVSKITSMHSPGVMVGDGSVVTVELREELK